MQVDAAATRGRLDHSWRWIGYDECNYTYIPEGIELLNKFSHLGDGPYYVRTHFMFCTGNCHGTYKFGSTNVYTEDENGAPVYDFEYYDKVIDAYLATGTKPFVELGFMPMDLVDTDYLRPVEGAWNKYGQYKETGWTCPPKSYDKWHAFIKELMSHLVSKYGKEEVLTWYFELWNEPDIFYWSGTAAEYCKLYDYTEDAFHAVLPDGRLSGPAVTGIKEGQRSQQFFDFFLEHCKEGANFVSGKKGTRLDFITFHVKGGGFPFTVPAKVKKETPSVKTLVRQVKLGLDSIVKYGYRDLEVVLSEADPDGWAAGGIYDNANMKFRNTEYYATYVASSYDRIEKLCEEYGMTVRPLAWAFFFPGERCFEGTRVFTTQGIDKAVLNMFKIYGKLGYEKLACSCDGAAKFDYADPNDYDLPARDADVGAFAVRGEKGETQIVVFSHHDDWDKSQENTVALAVKGLAKGAKRITHHRIDAQHSNPYREWVALGKPHYPTAEQYAKIKAADGLEEFKPAEQAESDGTLSLSFVLPAHGVSFITIA